jgi:hypothetical protein
MIENGGFLGFAAKGNAPKLPEFNIETVWKNDSEQKSQLSIEYGRLPSPAVEVGATIEEPNLAPSSFLSYFKKITQSDDKKMYQCTWDTGSGICGKTFTRKGENAKAHW